MSDTPKELIRAEISAHGPITFARFMELALYGETGYYAHPPVGAAGDFVTSPHVHEVFAELLARGISELRELLGRPEPFRVTEVGAGDGTLARQLLPQLEAEGTVAYTAVEISVGARKALGTVDDVDVAARAPGTTAHVTVANELLDNLPFRLVRDDREVRIALDAGGDLIETLADPDEELAPHLDRPDGIVSTAALAFVEGLARGLVIAGLAGAGGYALLIDYGGAGEAGGPAHGYAGHAVVEDVLADPGATDITAGVDMDLMADHALTCGATAFPVVTQRAALAALGFEDWFREQLATQHGQLGAGDGMAAVRTWSAKSRATLLADPAGLGRFRWLLLASPGLPEPGWLRSASDLRLG